MNVHRVNHIRQTDMHTAESVAPEHSTLEDKIAINNLKRYRSPNSIRIDPSKG